MRSCWRFSSRKRAWPPMISEPCASSSSSSVSAEASVSMNACSLRPERRVDEAARRRSRADRQSDGALVEEVRRPVGEPRVDRLVEREHALGDGPGRRDDHDHHELRLQHQHLDAPHRGGLGRRARDHPEHVGDLRHRVGQAPHRRIDLPAHLPHLERAGDASRHRHLVALDQVVDVVAIPGVGGHPARGGVRVVQQAELLQPRELRAHGRRGEVEPLPPDDVLAPDGAARVDVSLHDHPQDRLLPRCEPLVRHDPYSISSPSTLFWRNRPSRESSTRSPS